MGGSDHEQHEHAAAGRAGSQQDDLLKDTRAKSSRTRRRGRWLRCGAAGAKAKE